MKVWLHLDRQFKGVMQNDRVSHTVRNELVEKKCLPGQLQVKNIQSSSFKLYKRFRQRLGCLIPPSSAPFVESDYTAREQHGTRVGATCDRQCGQTHIK